MGVLISLHIFQFNYFNESGVVNCLSLTGGMWLQPFMNTHIYIYINYICILYIYYVQSYIS